MTRPATQMKKSCPTRARSREGAAGRASTTSLNKTRSTKSSIDWVLFRLFRVSAVFDRETPRSRRPLLFGSTDCRCGVRKTAPRTEQARRAGGRRGVRGFQPADRPDPLAAAEERCEKQYGLRVLREAQGVLLPALRVDPRGRARLDRQVRQGKAEPLHQAVRPKNRRQSRTESPRKSTPSAKTASTSTRATSESTRSSTPQRSSP